MTTSLADQIDQWRTYLQRRQAIQAVDAAELEDHLREQIAGSSTPGSTPTRRSWWPSFRRCSGLPDGDRRAVS